jgi:hypothetical protein
MANRDDPVSEISEPPALALVGFSPVGLVMVWPIAKDAHAREPVSFVIEVRFGIDLLLGAILGAIRQFAASRQNGRLCVFPE